MNEICERFLYINKINQNILDIDVSQLKRAFEAIKEADCIILLAEGRSQSALYSGIRGIEKPVTAIEGVNFSWRNIYQAAPFLEKDYEKIVLLVSSGSGETLTPRIEVKNLTDYIKETGSKKFTIVGIGSHSNSSIGKSIKEVRGIFLRLKGREKEPESSREYQIYGIMNDVYELASLVVSLEIKEGVNNKKDADWVFQEMKDEMGTVGKIVDGYVDSKHYRNLVEKMTTQHRIIFGGLGPSREAAKMATIRVQHIKQVICGRAALSGSLAPHPLPGDVFVAISWSGETEAVIQWARNYLKRKGIVFSIVGNESTLSKETESFIINASESHFYTRANFLLSALTMGLINELGIYIPEHLMRRLGHSGTE